MFLSFYYRSHNCRFNFTKTWNEQFGAAEASASSGAVSIVRYSHNAMLDATSLSENLKGNFLLIQIMANNTLRINVNILERKLAAIAVIILKFNAIEQYTALKAGHRLHQDELLLSCHQIWCKLHFSFTV